MQVKVRKIGNSSGIIIPADLLKKYNIQAGDDVDIVETSKGIHIMPPSDAFKEFDEIHDKILLHFHQTFKALAK